MQILGLMVEGMSMRSITRITGASLNTVAKLLRDGGEAADAHHHENLRDVRAAHVECDELWSFVYSKAANVERAKAAPEAAGDVWTFTALDAASKLILSYLVGPRDGVAARDFMEDLRGRVLGRPQISTDGLAAYTEAVDDAFGSTAHFAQLVKLYGSDGSCIGSEKVTVRGAPNIQRVSTSYVERCNLTIRMGLRRYARQTNAFSKRLENHCRSLCLYFYWYNWCRPHSAVRTKWNNRITPAMAAGLADRPATLEQLVDMIDARAPKPNRPKTYKRRVSN